MKLDRTMILAMGLAAAGLLTLGLRLGTERSSTRGPPVPAAPPAERACVAVVAEHAACALPARHTGHASSLRESSLVR